MRRALLAVVCAAAAAGTAPRARALLHAAPDACVDDPAWVKNGPEPDKDCAWVSAYTPTRCLVRGEDGRTAQQACQCACDTSTDAPSAAPTIIPSYKPTTPGPAASLLRKLIVADPKRRKHRARYVALRSVIRIQWGFRAKHLRRRMARRSQQGYLPELRTGEGSIRSLGDVSGDGKRPDLSGDSSDFIGAAAASGARHRGAAHDSAGDFLSLSAAAERVAKTLKLKESVDALVGGS